jgi:hypothetical protein
MKPKYNVSGKEFIIENYNNSKAFASFFPAISGEWGKPIWVYYVNRGQAISCFGTKDKDGAILEFQAANKSYRYTPLQGFRTFIKENNSLYEPFQNDPLNEKNGITQSMHITAYKLILIDTNKKLGLETRVEYFTMPNETFPALVRKMTIKNLSKKVRNIECIDGMPMITPYGTNNFLLKHISRLAEGWYNGVFFSKKYKVPVYKLPIEPVDRPEVIPIHSGNFYSGFYFNAGKIVYPKYIIDPDVLFGEVKDFKFPEKFITSKVFKINSNLTGKNKTPSAMGYFKLNLKPNAEQTYYSVIGNAHNHEDIDSIVSTITKKDYLENKETENEILINSINNDVLTKSSSQKFDNYCEQNFLDNLLRGGYPVMLGKNESKKNYYVYSRIHGDMEREYNNFVILPEYFSQGNGNYRDVNQNRRNDIFFNPLIKEEQIVTFMNLLQVDGFNPLKILGSKFKINDKKSFLNNFEEKDKSIIEKFITDAFTLGSFFNFLEDKNIHSKISNNELLDSIMKYSLKIDLADPGECYWSDHWHYNLDLIEAFQAIYPDEIQNLLFNKKVFTFYDNPHIVLPRSEKHVLFQNEPKQLNSVYVHPEKEALISSRKENKNIMRTNFGQGQIYKTTLISKLLNLIANKYASLDPQCIGLEMESDRPNWCDALNGLPGVFGSSTAESFELKRFLIFLKETLKNTSDSINISIPEEVLELLLKLEKITNSTQNNLFDFWDETHSAKEEFREKTILGISGTEKNISIEQIKNIVNLFLEKISDNIENSLDTKSGVIFTNFEYVPKEYSIVEENNKPKKNYMGHSCIKITKFDKAPTPLFLEGPVHFLRINKDTNTAKKMHENILKSGLYDKKLKMIKINAPLDNVKLSIGRIKIFTPGWLENESIWLHMEYKYMLELLRNNLCDEFYKLSDTALVPFMDPKIYGRSIFENSSFIVSSAHPELDIQGQGFVARLSGSTAEFISMWISITSGLFPFYLDEKNNLNLKFSPQIPSKLFTTKTEEINIYSHDGKIEKVKIEKNSFAFKFLGKTLVIYNNPSRKNTYGANSAKIKNITLIYTDNKIVDIAGEIIYNNYANDVRSGKIKQINVMLG